MKRFKLFGKASALAACGSTIAYSATTLSYRTSLSLAGSGLAASGLAAGVLGAITIGEDIIKQLVDKE